MCKKFNLQPFATRLKEERHRLQLKQDEIAQIGHVSLGSQAGYEAATRAPDAKYLALLEKFGVDILYLLSGKSAKENAITNFDWEKHDAILQIVENWEHSLKIEVEFEMKMAILQIIFMGSTDNDELDQGYIDITLELFAKALNKPPQSEVKVKAS